jgi:hypothetical protein
MACSQESKCEIYNREEIFNISRFGGKRSFVKRAKNVEILARQTG